MLKKENEMKTHLPLLIVLLAAIPIAFVVLTQRVTPVRTDDGHVGHFSLPDIEHGFVHSADCPACLRNKE
jgi:hypothetical protein